MIKKLIICVLTVLFITGCMRSPSSETAGSQNNESVSQITENSESTTKESSEIETTTIHETTITEEITKETTEAITKETETKETGTKENVIEETSSERVTVKEPDKRPDNLQQKSDALSVKNGNLVDSKGKKVVLRGVSTHGLSWYPQYVNKNAFKQMRDEWGVNTIRLAMYTAEYNGYCTGDTNNKHTLMNLIDNGVSYCTELGMYVIIDWHVLNDANPNNYKNEAIDFFSKVSKKYASHTNVIYEICNEPNGGTSWNEIKSYAKDVISTIRKNDKDAIIIVGTPTWSQDVDIAANDPIDEKNVMYALHFYADTHRDDIRNKLVQAKKKGLAIIVSEFGICDSSGNGPVNTIEANKWMQLLEEYSISYAIWNLSNKQETCALINSGCHKTSGWEYNDLSQSGKWFVDMNSR